MTATGLGKRVATVDSAKRADLTEHGIEIDVARSAPQPCSVTNTLAQTVEQLHDLSACIGAVKRRIAGKALARTGKERDDRFEFVGHPYRHAVATHEPVTVQIRRDAIDPCRHLTPRQPSPPSRNAAASGRVLAWPASRL